ncbi:MAG TPA: site-specific integrase [Kiritimatiellia bacterium]|nr:site-specific integrase [Kiritimatiellia bacterium]
MALEIRRGRDGKLIGNWYGSFVDSTGKRRVVALTERLPVKHYPGSLRETGNAIFEASRGRAEKELEAFQSDARSKGRADELTAKLIESRTGAKVEYAKLADLPQLWRGIDREGDKPSEKHLEWCDSVFERFAEAVPCEYLYEVKSEHIKTFLNGMRKTHTHKTVKDMTTVIRAAFTRLLPVGAENPFSKTIRKRKARKADDGGTAGRKALTDAQLERLYETARPDPTLYALTVCAACTGMRIGDVCLLQWASVDLREGWVKVATSKTGVEVEIPIFDRLREVLEIALAEREPDAVYVWPDAARMMTGKKNPNFNPEDWREEDKPKDKKEARRWKIEKRRAQYLELPNPDGIYYRGKALFARAFADTPKNALKAHQDAPESADLAEVFPEVAEAVRGAGFAASKRDRIMDTLTRYARGESYRDIEKATGRQRPQISEDLREAERLTGLRLRRGLIGTKGTTKKSGRDLKTLIAGTRKPRTIGQYAASVWGWHNLRGTFVVIALGEGVDFETVVKCTGHTTAKTARDHYYNPTREHTKQAMRNAGLRLSGGAASRQIGTGGTVADLAEQLKALSPADRRQLAKLLK